MAYELRRDGLLVSTDPSLLDVDMVHAFITKESYWAPGMSRPRLERALEHSIPFGVYDGTRQVAFARLITDRATFAYVADVFVVESHRGRGVSKLLLEGLLANPETPHLRRWMLGTRDAHGLYAQFGFIPLEEPGRWMELADAQSYAKAP